MSIQTRAGFLERSLKGSIATVSDVRQADMSDLEALEKMLCEYTYLLFGDINAGVILDKSHLSVCLENQDGELVGLICLNDHPNVPSIPPWGWEKWLYNIYHLELITPRNTLWMHLAVWDSKYTYCFVMPLFQSVFATNPFLEYVVLVVPPGDIKLDWLSGHGTRILPEGFSESHKVQTLYLIVRQHFVTRYRIRRAVEEDNDDLVPLIHRFSERLEQHYGKFYIAEMLTRHPDSGRQIIVAEYSEHAVAVMCLNETVNLELLTEAFELTPFYGLRKPHEHDEIEFPELNRQASGLAMTMEEGHEATESFTVLKNFNETLERQSEESIEPLGSDEIELAHTGASEESIDAFSIVNVSSLHLSINSFDEDLISLKSCPSDFSAVILSFNEYEMHLFADKSGKNMSFIDLDHHTSKQLKGQQDLAKLPSFHGETNAFCLELAAAHPDHEIESLALLLEAAFECFPERDYCVLSIPSTCPPFPLLRHFAKVPPRPVSSYPQELFVAHRNAVLSNMTVREAARSDVNEVEELVSNMLQTDLLLVNFKEAINVGRVYRAYVLLTEDQMVGVAIVKEEEDYEYLKSHYELIYWIDDNHHKSDAHGLLDHLVLSPIFFRHSRFFLREVHRLSDYSALYYCVYPSDAVSMRNERSLCCVISDLIAIRPRPKPEFTHCNLEGCAPADVVHRADAPFALYLSTARHCTLPRYEVSRKIVIVGSSDTAVAFMDSLLCSWSTSYYVVFTNVSVVSPHGLPYQKSDNRVRDMLFVKRSNFNYRHMHLTSLKTYVNLVNAVMTGIDRKNKLLIVNDTQFVAYDYLFLICGEQFQKPTIPNSQKEQGHKGNKADFPENCFLINTETDATNALTKLKILTLDHPKQQYTVIVYGFYLEAYCCLAALLEYGVPGGNLAFVEPFPVVSQTKFAHKVSHFNDGEVDEAVHAAIEAEGIAVYPSYYFTDWSYDKNTNHITSAKFESRNKRIDLECIAMFMYNEKTVSGRTFSAINRAGLVFDGGLVVKQDCQTNDSSIYAAGTITKYSRRYYADHMAHKYYNLAEIGHTLAQHIRKKLIPFCNEGKDEGLLVCSPGNMLVPSYQKPLQTFCRLPGNLRYFSVTKPGKQIPLEVSMSSDDYGQVLVTGDCKQIDKQGYFRLHLNEHGMVETITCLAKFVRFLGDLVSSSSIKDIDCVNLMSLWGKHERLLNNLQMRFEMVLVTDLFEYFREPWSCAIYHDRFPLLEQGIRELLTAYTPVAGESLLEDLMRMYKTNDWTPLTFDQKEEIDEKFTGSPYYKLLEQKVLDFLRDNDTFLPMYAHPNVVRFLLQGFQNSSFFELQ